MQGFDMSELKGAIGKPKGKKTSGKGQIKPSNRPKSDMRNAAGPPMGGNRGRPQGFDMGELKNKMKKQKKKKEHVVKGK